MRDRLYLAGIDDISQARRVLDDLMREGAVFTSREHGLYEPPEEFRHGNIEHYRRGGFDG